MKTGLLAAIKEWEVCRVAVPGFLRSGSQMTSSGSQKRMQKKWEVDIGGTRAGGAKYHLVIELEKVRPTNLRFKTAMGARKGRLRGLSWERRKVRKGGGRPKKKGEVGSLGISDQQISVVLVKAGLNPNVAGR